MLFFVRRPFAIIGRISLAVLDAFYCVSRRALWSRPHISQKVLKQVPTLTDRDSTTSIVFILRRLWIVAPLPHLNPNSVFGCSPASIFSGPVFGDGFQLKTTTASVRSGTQAIAMSDGLPAAITDTFPDKFRSFFAVTPNNEQSSKYLSCKINSSSHKRRFSSSVKYITEWRIM